MAMSDINIGNPVTGTGGITRAPLGTALPKDAVEKLNAAFKALGYISEDGVTRTTDASDDKVKAWGGYDVKVIRSDYSVKYVFTFLESSNAEVLKAIYGENNVTITPPSGDTHGKVAVKQNKSIAPAASYTIEMKDGDVTLREVIPNGQITTSGDVVFVHTDVIKYEVTIDALVDADGNNAYSYQDGPGIGAGAA